ncbi:hypothetical protein ACVXG7_18250 [Enterobacter hormaechei]
MAEVATTLGDPSSRRKSPLRGTFGLFLQAIGSGMSLHPCRPRPRRIPAPRPGLQETPQRFTAGPGHR